MAISPRAESAVFNAITTPVVIIPKAAANPVFNVKTHERDRGHLR
jgi:hypothetical protein